ncbi:MAG: hypothetical protein U9N42_02840 [Campylobacterota bacterium]|nr:hypothetical protein [Campylobacterota bacterium]
MTTVLDYIVMILFVLLVIYIFRGYHIKRLEELSESEKDIDELHVDDNLDTKEQK